jgi:hypothetical protein
MSAGAATETECLPTPVDSPRAIEGHVFQISELVPGPFSMTAFGTSTGIGYGNTHSGAYELLGREFGNRDYGLIGLSQSFDVQFRVIPDLGLRFSAGGGGYSSTDALGVLVAGSVGIYDLHAGLVLGHTWGAIRPAIVGDIGIRPSYSLLVGSAVIDTIQNQEVSTNVLQSTSSLYLNPGVSVAMALHRSFGLIGEARFIWTKLETGTDIQQTRTGAQLGASADLDFDPLIGWPIGIQGVWHLETRFNTDGIRRQMDLGGAIYYTRRVRLQLGLEITRRTGELRREPVPNLDLSLGIAQLTLRYHW